jgi:hypothetical protein
MNDIGSDECTPCETMIGNLEKRVLASVVVGTVLIIGGLWSRRMLAVILGAGFVTSSAFAGKPREALAASTCAAAMYGMLCMITSNNKLA